jgi:hypothetical protein
MIDKLLRSEEKRRNYELHKSNTLVITPLRLRAYERLILVLERTSPTSLLVNTTKPDQTNKELHALLLTSIREEFSHNLSQQIYVSDELWNYIRVAQESLLRLINTCAVQCNPVDSASNLAELILQVYSNSEQSPTEIAQLKLKNEVRSFLQ